MTQVSHIQHHTQSRLDARHVIGSKLTHLIAHLTMEHIHLTDKMCQLARIDLHRTGGGTESIGGAGLVTIVFILFAQGGCTLGISTRSLQLAYLTLYGYAHTT